MKLTGNEILITGGTSGIGLALATNLLEKGNQVVVLGRRQDKLAAVQAQHPKLLTFQADVGQPESLQPLLTWLPAHLPKLNMVINSAGIMQPHDLLDPHLTLTALTADIQINLMGTIAVDQLLLSQLLAQEEAMIVNVSSGLAYLSSAPHPTYSASKAGVHMFTSALREQLAYANKNQVHVLELVPPLVSETGLQSGDLASSFGNMKLADLVEVTLKGMAQNKPRINAGAAKLLQKMEQIMPNQAEKMIAKDSLKQFFPEGL